MATGALRTLKDNATRILSAFGSRMSVSRLLQGDCQMAGELSRLMDIFRRRKPSFAKALAKHGFRPAGVKRIKVGERRTRERLLRHRG